MAEKNQNTGIEEELSFDVGMGPVPSATHLSDGQELPLLQASSHNKET